MEDDLGNEEEMVKGVGAPEWEATILSLLQPVSSSDYPYHCTQGSLPVPKAQFMLPKGLKNYTKFTINFLNMGLKKCTFGSLIH